MSYQEKQNIVNIFSGVLITSIYAVIVYKKHLQGRFDLTADFDKWGVIFLIFIGVSIVVRILIQIIFHIINAIATREVKTPVEDERDKLIKLKSTRNSYYAFTGGFVLAVVGLAVGMPVYGIFIAFVGFGLIAEIIEMALKFTITGRESEMAKSKIQNNIRSLRFHAGEMTQQQLADKVEVSRQTIVAIEKGNYSPSLELAFKLARTFNTPLEEVFSYEAGEEKL